VRVHPVESLLVGNVERHALVEVDSVHVPESKVASLGNDREHVCVGFSKSKFQGQNDLCGVRHKYLSVGDRMMEKTNLDVERLSCNAKPGFLGVDRKRERALQRLVSKSDGD
jgi:hypothetical protein